MTLVIVSHAALVCVWVFISCHMNYAVSLFFFLTREGTHEDTVQKIIQTMCECMRLPSMKDGGIC